MLTFPADLSDPFGDFDQEPDSAAERSYLSACAVADSYADYIEHEAQNRESEAAITEAADLTLHLATLLTDEATAAKAIYQSPATVRGALWSFVGACYRLQAPDAERV